MRISPVQARRAYLSEHHYARALASLVRIMQAGASAECVALFIRRQRVGTSMRLSWAIEDVSHPGTFAESVFNILAG